MLPTTNFYLPLVHNLSPQMSHKRRNKFALVQYLYPLQAFDDRPRLGSSNNAGPNSSSSPHMSATLPKFQSTPQQNVPPASPRKQDSNTKKRKLTHDKPGTSKAAKEKPVKKPCVKKTTTHKDPPSSDQQAQDIEDMVTKHRAKMGMTPTASETPNTPAAIRNRDFALDAAYTGGKL